MQIIDIITIVIGIALVILGYVRGFGKSLKTFTGGIVGIIISLFVCVAFGGMILGLPFVNTAMTELNGFLSSKWAFLGQIQLCVVIFYVVMFFVAQGIRILMVKIICAIFEANNPAIKAINKLLGAIFVPTVCFVFLLLILAFLRLGENTATVTNMMAKIEGSFIARLYEINPIALHI